MSSWYTVKSVLLLALMIEVKTQFYDIFQGYQPVIQTYPTVSSVTHRRTQYQIVYSPDGTVRNTGNPSVAIYNQPNIQETRIERTTAKPVQRYSSQSYTVNSRASNKNKNTGSTSEEDGNYWNYDSAKKKKPNDGAIDNNYFADTYFAVRPLHKLTTKSPFSIDRDSSYETDYTRSSQRPNKHNSYSTAKPAYNNDRNIYNKQSTEKSTYNINSGESSRNSHSTGKPTHNNDGRNIYNKSSTEKLNNNNNRHGSNNDESSYNKTTVKTTYNRDNKPSTEKPNYNIDRHDSNNGDSSYNSYTTEKSTYNNDRNTYNKQSTEKSIYNIDRHGSNNGESSFNSHTTVKPTYSNDRNIYNKQSTEKSLYNNDRHGSNNDETSYNSFTTKKPAYNSDNDGNNFNKQSTEITTYNNNDRHGYNNEDTDSNRYTTAKPAYNNVRNNNNKQTTEKSYDVAFGNNRYYDYTTKSTIDRTNRRPFITQKPKQNHHRTNLDSQENYTTKDYQRPYNSYTTENPFYNRPGVKPAVVQGPPITNRPLEKPGHNKFGYTDDEILFPEDPHKAPSVVSGPDVDVLSDAAKRRYLELTERMCDKYKSLDISQVAAIPLLPAPEPVTFNVSDCNPLSTPLIVGGKVVNIEEFPHNAAVGWPKLEGGGYSWKCGGSLISELFVLTAAHCSLQERDDSVASGPPHVVQLGSSYLNDVGALVVRVTKAVRHPRYKLPRSYYDIALLKLGGAVRFSQVIKPACLGAPPPVGDSIIATGWGRTEFGGESSHELRGVSIPVWDLDECSRTLGTSRKLPDGPSADSQLCAGEVNGMRDTCQGDSGGPAQIQDGCAWRVIGVTSLGRACGAPRTPAIYATIDRVWIGAVLDEYR